MSHRPLSDIANTETRIDEFDLRVRRGSPAELARALLEGIGDVYPPLRQRAAKTAADIDDPALRSVFSGLVAGESRVDALRETHGLDEDDVPPPNAPVRQAACLALRGAPDADSLSALIEASDDEDSDVRYQALVSLHFRQASDDTLRPLVDRRLDDEDPEVQIIAAQIIADRGWTDFTDRLETYWRDASGEFQLQLSFALAEIAAKTDTELGDDVHDRLVAHLIDALGDDATMAAAARALAALDADQARDTLRAVVGKWFGHPLNKVEAAAALVELGDQTGRDYLEKSLDSQRKDARGYAIRLVGRLHLDEYFDALVQKARSTDYHADSAVLALGDFGGRQAREILQELAENHPDSDVMELAEQTLGELDSKQDTP